MLKSAKIIIRIVETIPAGTADADTVKTMTIMKMQRNLEAIADLPV